MRFFLCLSAVLLAIRAPLSAQERAERVRRDREEFLSGGRWIYNDIPKGIAEARRTGRPLLVVLRCIPCEACRGFDEGVASFDERVEQLLERFVRVRIPQANGLDLSLFQFDYDLSFYAFFLNADGTIYGRFGSRSTQEDKKGEASIAAFRETLHAVLDLHARFLQVRESLVAKRGASPRYKVPEEYPSLKGKYRAKLDYEGKVVESCIHCHQVREAERLMHRAAREPIPDRVLYPWPSADVFGLRLDPRRRATVASVDDGSTAAKLGFAPGDELVALEGQPLVSAADIEWVLENAGEEGTLRAEVRRDGEVRTVEIPLEPEWRRRADISWRASTWDLRRMGTGGLLLEDLSSEERREKGLAEGALALRVKHAGAYGEHATAKNAGARKGDIIVEVDGRDEPLRESDLIALAVQRKKPGERLELTVLRDGERRMVTFPVR